MIVKTIKPTPQHVEFTQYQWYEMSFISTFGKQRNLLLCLDTPRYLAYNIFDALSAEENKDIATGPYGLHQVLLEQLMILYDESVWDIARIMRNNEKSKGVCIFGFADCSNTKLTGASEQPMGNTDLHYFIKLYEDSRHTIHSIEATQEATKVVECITRQCATLAAQKTTHQELLSSRLEMLKFQHTMMQGFLARAVSNDRRMGNEQNLVSKSPQLLALYLAKTLMLVLTTLKTSNLMSQLDAKTNVDIAMATKDDGAAMKTIAVVTMTFLPATFVSVRITS